MNEIKKITLPVIIGVLSLVFMLASLMLALHKGKSAKWVARKMKLGGLILSLTAILQACDPAQTAALIDNNPPWTCYMVAEQPGEPTNQFFVNTNNDSVLTLHLSTNNKIEGEIKKREGDTFSFALFDLQDSVYQKENILPKDGAFDEINETFEIQLDKTLKKGDYLIRFYAVEKENQSEWSEQYFNLKIK